MSDARALTPPSTFRVARLTAPGPGAIATIVAEGPASAQVVGRYFLPRARIEPGSFPIGRIFYGRWRNSRSTEEEVVVCRSAPCEWEIHCHGGDAAVETILTSLVAAGAMRESSDSWLTRRVADPIQRAALYWLSRATTPRGAAILLDQYRGALRRAVESCIEDLQTRDRRRAPFAAERAEDVLQRLCELSPAGLHLVTPWRIAFAGPPNVGKSSLINAVLGYERAIVFDQPGTTRDVLTASTALFGWPCELSDTAGLRESGDEAEAAGIALARRRMASADLIVLVQDATQQCLAETGPWSDAVEPWAAVPVIRVANKCDLARPRDVPTGMFCTSAATGAGLDPLLRAIIGRLVPCEPRPGEAVPFTESQVQSLMRMRHSVLAGEWDEACECGRRVLVSGVEHPGDLSYTRSNSDDDRCSTDWQ